MLRRCRLASLNFDAGEICNRWWVHRSRRMWTERSWIYSNNCFILIRSNAWCKSYSQLNTILVPFRKIVKVNDHKVSSTVLESHQDYLKIFSNRVRINGQFVIYFKVTILRHPCYYSSIEVLKILLPSQNKSTFIVSLTQTFLCLKGSRCPRGGGVNWGNSKFLCNN